MGSMKEKSEQKNVGIQQSTSGQRSGEQRGMEPARQQGLGGYGPGGYERRAVTPLSFVRRMMSDMDRLFGLGGITSPLMNDDLLLAPIEQVWVPQVEMLERDGNLVVRADLPGVAPEDVKVEIDGDTLLLQGERRSGFEESREGYFHSERSYGSFQRRIPLPRGVDLGSSEAVFDNGVLEISMKLPKTSTKSVPIRQQVQARGEQQQAPGQQAQQQQQEAPKQASQNGPQSAQRS